MIFSTASYIVLNNPKKRKPKLSDLDKTDTKIFGIVVSILTLINLAIMFYIYIS